MLSIIDDAALAFEFLFLSFFLLTAFFLGFGNGGFLIALAPHYSPHIAAIYSPI